METKTLLAPRHVMKRLKKSYSRVVQLDLEGKLPAMRDSAGRRLYDPALVEAFAQQREARALTPGTDEERS